MFGEHLMFLCLHILPFLLDPGNEKGTKVPIRQDTRCFYHILMELFGFPGSLTCYHIGQ